MSILKASWNIIKHSQTQTVLRQAWLEKLKPILVLNKMDRLITELKQSPLEAYNHLQNLLEQVNAVTASLFSVDTMKKEDEIYSKTKENDTSSGVSVVVVFYRFL